jgi:hypothetical protein
VEKAEWLNKVRTFLISDFYFSRGETGRFFFVFFFFGVLGLELRDFTLSHSTSPFCDEYFRDRVSRTICLGWL